MSEPLPHLEQIFPNLALLGYWLVRNRRLSRDYERSPRVSEAWIQVAMIKLALGRLSRA